MVGRTFNAFTAASGVLLALGWAGPTWAQQEVPQSVTASSTVAVELVTDTSSASEEERPKAFQITPIVAPGYTPELEFIVAGGGLLSFTPEPDNPNLPRSSFPIMAGYSTSGAFVGFARLNSFWLDDLLRVDLNLWLRDQPDHYFGVGIDSARTLEQGPDTAYKRRWWTFNPTVLLRMYGPLYGGISFDVNRTIARDVNEVMAQDPAFLEFGANNLNTGVGAVVRYDTRDLPYNAYEGLFVGASLMHYDDALGGDNTYQVMQLEYRQYIEIVRPGSTLALQILNRHGFGDVPWGELSMVGSPFDLRGYRWGRFRGNTSLFGIAEYRAMFEGDRKSWIGMGRFGFVFWAAAGSVGEDYGDLGQWLPNWGTGFRFELQNRMNLRLDWGFGEDSSAFYLNFNEAF